MLAVHRQHPHAVFARLAHDDFAGHDEDFLGGDGDVLAGADGRQRGCKPAVPTMAMSTMSAAGRVASLIKPSAPENTRVFTAAEAEVMEKAGKKVILIRKETSPEDVGGMHAAQGILTATGGKTSHAAVVARGWGKCCIVGCEALDIDYNTKQMKVGGKVIKQGDEITLNGTTGEVFISGLPLIKPEQSEEFRTLLKWCDEIRTMKVRTNADTPYDAQNAIMLGAEGIGLCRTEHMFFDTEERRLAIQEMIVAENLETRKKALAKLFPSSVRTLKAYLKR